MPDATLAAFDERAGGRFLFSPHERHYVVGYLIPGEHGSLVKPDRLISWVWCRRIDEDSDAWRDFMTGEDGVLHRTTVPSGLMSTSAKARLHEDARRLLIRFLGRPLWPRRNPL